MCSLFTLIAIVTLIGIGQSLTATVSSSSPIVGALANYSVTLSASTSIKQADFSFQTWTDTNANPFTSNTQVQFAGLTLNPVYFPLKLICILSSTFTGSTFTLTNIYNPSSTKPTSLTVTLYSSTGLSTSYSSTLTLSQITNSSYSLSSYATTVGATSSGAQFYLSPQYALQLTTSSLNITYDPTLISLSLGPNTQYTVISQSSGTIIVGSFSTSSSLLSIGNVTIVNPQAAVTYTINCLFYITSGAQNYSIEGFYSTNTLTPRAFTSINTTSALAHGVETNLMLASSCPYASVSNGINIPSSVLSFNSSQLSFSSSSSCQLASSSSCQFTSTGSDTLTLLTPSLLSFSTSSVTLTSRTYLNGQIYSLCSSALNIAVSQQTFTATVDTSQCSSNIIAGSNTINIVFSAYGVTTGDRVYIRGFQGTVSDAAWSMEVIDGNTWYYYTLLAADLTSTSGTSASGKVALTYLNPTYTCSPSLTSVALSRASFMYALATGPSLCAVTTPKTISTSSLSQSTTLTYSPNTITLQATFQIYDYKAGDHLFLAFTSTGDANSYLLLGSYIGIILSVSVNGITATVTQYNSTSLWITLASGMLPSQNSPVLTVKISNVANPPFQSNVGLKVTTHQANTNGTKETLTTSTLTYTPRTLNYTTSKVLLLANNYVTIVLSNSYRSLLNANPNVFTTVALSLPSTLSCPSITNSSLSLAWQASVSTSGTLYEGSTTSLSISLGQCYVNYFTGNMVFTVSETYNGIQSTTTQPSVTNLCGDGCYTCSGTVCTACFNTTYSTTAFLYNAQCYSTCPDGSYETSTTSCGSCHISCSTCSGPLYTDCKTCETNYTNSSGICLSVCGAGKYYSGGVCSSCDPNCQACLSSTSCYICKTNATMIESVCYFTTCLGNCLTCQGTQSACTSCSPGYSFYQQQCLQSCPSGTYQTSSSTCQQISGSNTYIPITLTGLVCVLALLALRAYSSKKVGSEPKRSRDYRQEVPIFYKINLWRLAAVLYAFLEIIAAAVMAFKNSSYSVSSAATPTAIVGLAFHLICNIVFIIGYCLISNKYRVANQQAQQPSTQMKMREKVVLGMTALSFRSYRLLQANLFIDRPSQVNEESLNPMASLPLTRTQEINSKTDVKHKQPLREINKQNIDSSNLQKKDKNSTAGKGQSVTPSKKAIRTNSLGDEINNQPALARTDSIIVTEENVLQKKINYPFLCYLTLASIMTSTLILLIAACLQLVTSSFSNMLFSGIDALIVTIISLLLCSWDLWNTHNLTPQELNSEMSSQNQEVNNTHENLKQIAEIEVQVEMSPKEAKSGTRPKRSNRSWGKDSRDEKDRAQGKGEAEEEMYEKPPLLKVFEDLQESQKTVAKQAKSKKFSSKNLRYCRKLPKTNVSVSNTRKHLQGELWDDLYINFQSGIPERDANTTYNYQKSHRSVSPNHSLAEKVLDLEGDFQEQPPNFPDISDIQDIKPEEEKELSPQFEEIDP